METLQAWQCIGCGRLEAPQTCLGVCQDRKVELVYAGELAASEAARADAERELEALRAFLRQLVATHPRDAQWETSFVSMQARARTLLARAA